MVCLNKRINFLENKIKENNICLLYAIEDISDIDFWVEDNKVSNFYINSIDNISKRNSTRTDFKLKIDVYIDNKIYKINDWFTYNYKTKYIDLTNNYILQLE